MASKSHGLIASLEVIERLSTGTEAFRSFLETSERLLMYFDQLRFDEAI